jgi:hypothetical protein
MSAIEDKVKALNAFRVLHVKLPPELFELVLNAHRQDIDLFAALSFIRALEAEGWIKKEAPKL